MEIRNLLQETEDILKKNGKTWRDVEWIGSKKWGWFDWYDFVVVANKDYCEHIQVASDLIVVGNNWWLERRDDDGLSYWVFKTLFKKPKKRVKPIRVMMEQGNPFFFYDLKEMNDMNYIKDEIRRLTKEDGYFETERRIAEDVYNKE